MKFRNDLPSVEEVKNADIVDYLSSLGITPAKVSRNNYWYFSPFRDETTPSFKVNRNINRWYDFGEGKGGNLVDFGIRYHKCSVSELLKKMSKPFSFQQQNTGVEKQDDDGKKIKIINEKEITSFALIRYLHKRRIPIEIATKFCKELITNCTAKITMQSGLKTMPADMNYGTKNSKQAALQKMLLLLKTDPIN